MKKDLELQYILKKIPEFVIKVAMILEENGFEAHLVGGSLRDILIGKDPNDYDIATNAYPEEIQKIFPKSVATGAKFGTINVIVNDENEEPQDIEVTTYRSEADYFKGRWPTKVEFTKKIEDDLARRDFTINAIALRLDNREILKQDLIDPFNGKNDLEKKLIRAVGDPVERFREDGLRPLRACRLSANLNFQIEDNTFQAIKKSLSVIDDISMERVRDELKKMVFNSPKPSYGFELMRKSGILKLIIPELLKGKDVFQPQYHNDDVYEHSLKAMDNAEDEVKFAALFHDIAKPVTKSEDKQGVHFYGHDIKGAQITENILKRLRFPKSEINRIGNLIKHHMFYYPNVDWRRNQYMENTEKIGNNNKITNLILLRHAVTDHNYKGIVSGQIDIVLNKEGINQARSISKELQKKFQIDQLFSSSLKRALQTAEIISQDLNLDVNTDSRFMERNFGELQGLSWAEFEKQFPSLAKHPLNSKVIQKNLPMGEGISMMESRVKVGLYNLIKSYMGKTILLVTHQGVIRIIQRIIKPILTQESLTEIQYTDINQNKVIDLGNCEYLELKIDNSLLDPNFLTDDELEKFAKDQLNPYDKTPGGWSDSAVRRLIKRVGGQEAIDQLMKLRIADAVANPKSVFNPKEINVLSERIAQVREKDMALKTSDLDVSGHDLIDYFQIKPGPQVGKILEYLLDKVIDDPLLNDKEKLLKLAQEFIKK